jgi:hypothetical protein
MELRQQGQPIITVTSLPNSLLRSIWDVAANKACELVKKAIRQGHNAALVLHAVYFKPNSTECVPLVDARILQSIAPKCVLHFIDDIYDAYKWLRQPSGIFDHSDCPEDGFRQSQRCIRDLMTTLVWRHAESGASQHLASMLGVPLFTFATKHRCRLLQRIFEKDVDAAYLSHPISEPRRQSVAGKEDLLAKCAAEVKQLAEHLSEKISIWEPTTIDELRLQQVEIVPSIGKNGTNVEKTILHLPRLWQRWPFGQGDEIPWPKPPDSVSDEPIDPVLFFTDDEIEKLKSCKTWDEVVKYLGEDKSTKLRFISGQLTDLASSIDQQINARDRTLINQCPVFILYRPVFNGNAATGVLRELQAHRRLVDLKQFSDQHLAKVFVLENSDDERLVWRNAVKELLISPDGHWSRFIKDNHGKHISAEYAEKIADSLTTKKKELSAKLVVDEMNSKELGLMWGDPSRSVLDGAAKGNAHMEFTNSRIQELDVVIQGRFQYKNVLSTYKRGQVALFRDKAVIDFSNDVIKLLTKGKG